MQAKMFRTLLRPTVSLARAAPRAAPMAAFTRCNSVNYKLNTQSHAYKYHKEGPSYVKFTQEHEWLAVHKDDTAFVGITSYAADALGDATFIELPEVGTTVDVGESIGLVESVKSASEIYSPVAGEVIAVNDVLTSKPHLINSDPQGEAWIAHIRLTEPAAVESADELMNVDEYEASLEEH